MRATHCPPIHKQARGFVRASVTKRKPNGEPYLTPTKPLYYFEHGWLIRSRIVCADGRILMQSTWFRTQRSADLWYQAITEESK